MTCSIEEVHLYDIGTAFDIPLMDCDVAADDIETAIEKIIIFRKPDGEVVIQTAVFKTDGTDGVIRYVTITGDLDQTGTWKIQGRVTTPAGTWSSEIGRFKVYTNLDA